MRIMVCATQFKGGSLQVVISLLNEFKKFTENEYFAIVSESLSKQVDKSRFPSNYTFFDYVKYGWPLQAVALILCLVLVPYVWPFQL